MPAEKGPLRLHIEAQLPAVIAAAWVESRPLTWSVLAQRIGPAVHPDTGELLPVVSPQTGYAVSTVMDVLRALEDQGRAGRHQASAAVVRGKTTAPLWFNWSSLVPNVATLRDALEPYLADSNVPGHRRQKLNEALRAVLPAMTGFRLGRKCSAHEILKAAALLDASRIHELPARAQAAGATRKSGEEHARHVRGLMRWAADRKLVPFYLPTPRPADAWESYKDKVFPLPAVGAADGTLRTSRRLWDEFRRAAVDKHGAPILERDPDTLTPNEAHAIVVHMRRVMGRGSVAGEVGAFLMRLRDLHGAGPYRALEPNPYVARGAYGARCPRHMLVGVDGERADGGDWAAFRRMLVGAGFGPEWQDFLAWYEQYSTLDARAIDRRRTEFPARPPKHELGRGAQERRIQALRLWLGAAVGALGIDAAELTPVEALGNRYHEIRSAVRDEWAERAAFAQARRDAGLPPEDTVSDASSKGVEHYILAIGMMAQALLRRLQLQHAQRRTNDLRRAGDTGVIKIDKRAMRGGISEPDEQALNEAYEDSQLQAQMLKAARIERNGKTGDSNTAKSLDRIIDEMPARKWHAIYQELLKQIERMHRKRGGVYTQRFCSLVRHALVLSVLLSTACRESELYHLRFDIQFDRAKRVIVWRAIDRKNRKRHFGTLRPGLVPDWLLDLWCDECRPWLMTGQHVAAGRTPVAPHEFVFTNLDGHAIGCVEEDPHGGHRDLAGFENRKGHASTSFLNTLAATAAALGIVLPEGWGEFSEHAIRGAVAHDVASDPELGPEAAAKLLGDELRTILTSYARRDARTVDVTLLAAFGDLRHGSGERGGASNRLGPNGGAASVMEWVTAVQQLADAGLAGDLLNVAAEGLRVRYGVSDDAPAPSAIARSSQPWSRGSSVTPIRGAA
jgi:integrase